MKFYVVVFCALAIALSGCANYSWKSSVPQENRAVFVGVFKNTSNVTGIGNSIARQVAREFQREGTYKVHHPFIFVLILSNFNDIINNENKHEFCKNKYRIISLGIAIQGTVDTVSSSLVALNREVGMMHREYRMTGVAKVSFIDKKAGRVLVDNRVYKAYTTFLNSGDMITSKKDASERLAEDFAKQIVDDALTLNWEETKNDK